MLHMTIYLLFVPYHTHTADYVFPPPSRLGLHLPYKVDSKQSRARWLSEAEVLEITLRMQREYDFLNK